MMTTEVQLISVTSLLIDGWFIPGDQYIQKWQCVLLALFCYSELYDSWANGVEICKELRVEVLSM